MRRKTIMIAGVVLLVFIGIATTLYLLVRYEPGFYRAKAVEEGPIRTKHSKLFVQKFFNLWGDIYNEQKTWHANFSEAQINSYFDEDFIQQGMAEKILPKGIRKPRISIEKDVVHLGFQYGNSPWSTIVSIDFRVWMVPKDTNVVALELLSLQAGALPISSKLLMKKIEEFAELQNAERTNMEVNWYRYKGNPVAVLRFLGSRPQPTAQLRQLTVGQGMITISGKSLDVNSRAELR